MKKIVVSGLCILLSACGTLSTISGDQPEIGRKLTKHKSHCETMPRVYSGVAYNVCKMNSAPTDWGTIHLSFAILDSFLSAGLDTVALPYTAYQQTQNGQLDLRAHLK
jgi:uncharacterized protein YceK